MLNSGSEILPLANALIPQKDYGPRRKTLVTQHVGLAEWRGTVIPQMAARPVTEPEDVTGMCYIRIFSCIYGMRQRYGS
jgi:hypothetical protein